MRLQRPAGLHLPMRHSTGNAAYKVLRQSWGSAGAFGLAACAAAVICRSGRLGLGGAAGGFRLGEAAGRGIAAGDKSCCCHRSCQQGAKYTFRHEKIPSFQVLRFKDPNIFPIVPGKHIYILAENNIHFYQKSAVSLLISRHFYKNSCADISLFQKIKKQPGKIPDSIFPSCGHYSCLIAERALILTARLAGEKPESSPTSVAKATAPNASQTGMIELPPMEVMPK